MGRAALPVVVDPSGALLRRTAGGWDTVPGPFAPVTTAPDGSLYAVGTDGLGYAFTAYGRQIIAGNIADLASGPQGTWLVKRDGRILRSV